MKIISVDNEPLAVEYMEKLLRKVEPEASFTGFTSASEALAYLDKNEADVALLDIEMEDSDGIRLAEQCEKRYPQLNIIFVTGYSQYMLDAFKLHASGYLLKPVRAADLRHELDNLRHPVSVAPPCRVRVQTFGNFEIFVDEKPLKLPLTKCRETLAYLIDRKGAIINMAELAGILWEDRPLDHSMRNNVHKVISSLMKALREEGVEDIVIKYSRGIAIDPSKIDCDYYRALAGDMNQINRFTGEYMRNYSWAEFSVGGLLDLETKN